MSFSNPAGQAESGAAAYTQALLELLGQRDPLKVQEQMVPAIEGAVADLDEDMLRRPEAAGKWSILEVVQHMADNELAHTFRMRKILAEDEPQLEGFDQDLWAQRLDYARGDLRDALERFRALRSANLRMLRSLDDVQLDRVGWHSERGKESVRRISHLIAAHDLVHRNQIERIRRAIGATGTGGSRRSHAS